MVVIGCAAFAANTLANTYISRNAISSLFAALAVGTLGNVNYLLFGGTAFTSMITGVLFLLPSGVAAAGGLAQNYQSQSGDQFSNGLEIGMRMIEVSIGIIFGLFASQFFVSIFLRNGKKGKGMHWGI